MYLYAVSFEGDLLKVGRATSPRRRLSSHITRLAVAGVKPISQHTAPCVGNLIQAERLVIKRCAQIAADKRSYEWFTGVPFATVVGWIDEICSMPAEDFAPCDSAIQRAVELLGSQQKLADAAGVSPQAVSFWVKGERAISPLYAKKIRDATHGAVTLEELCPEIYGEAA